MLCIPYVSTELYGERSFSYISPTLQHSETHSQKILDSLSQPLPLNQHFKVTFSQHDTDWYVCVCVCVCVMSRLSA